MSARAGSARVHPDTPEALCTDRLLEVDPTNLDDALQVIADLRKKVQQSRRRASKHGADCSIEHYFEKSTFGILMQRLPWLISLLLVESISAYSLGRFQTMIDQHMTLALFCPMIVGTAGNAGNQPGVIFTRAITMGEFENRDTLLQFFRREFFLALIVSSCMAFVALARTVVEHGEEDLMSCIAVAATVFVVVIFAICIGITFSFCLHLLGLDPAAGAAPLLTTFSDVIGVLILCFISTFIFWAQGRDFEAGD